MVTLAQAKAHCRVHHDDDDDELTGMIAAASDHLSSIGVDVSSSPMPAAVSHAILMLIGHFYENREAVATGTISTEVKLGVDRLVQPYREICL